MIPERKHELLKNCLVLRVQKQDDWAAPIEEAVREELGKVISGWLQATETERVGPREAVAYLDRLWLLIQNEKLLLPPAQAPDWIPE